MNSQAAKNWKSWNPFQKLTGEAEASSAAKTGAIVGGYLSLSYLIQTALVYWGGQDAFGNTGMETLIADVMGIVFGAFLAWQILVRQPLWAAILVGVWVGVEIAMKLMFMAETHHTPNAGGLFLMFALVAATILAVRGSWALRVLRRSAK